MELLFNKVSTVGNPNAQEGQKKPLSEKPVAVKASTDCFVSCDEDVKSEKTEEPKKEVKPDNVNKENEELLKLLDDEHKKLFKVLDAEDQESVLKLWNSFKPKDPTAKDYKDEVDTTLTLITLLIKRRVNLIKSTNELADFVKTNKLPFAETVSKLLKEHKFVLWGETHLDDKYNIPGELIKLLPALKKEAEEKGEEFILAVEFDVAFKDLIESLGNPEKFKNEYLKLYPESEREKVEEAIRDEKITKDEFRTLLSNARGKLKEIVYEAHKLGIKVVPVDHLPYYHKAENPTNERAYQGITPTQAQKRDTVMSEMTSGLSGPKVRVMFYGGSFHTSEVPTTDDHWGRIETMGALLRKKFGDEAVASLRSVDNRVGFTAMSNQDSIIVLNDTKVLPPPAAVMSRLGEKNIVIVPSGGLIKTKDGHHDYVIIDNAGSK